MQSNGLHLSQTLISLLAANSVKIGFSLDGPASANDASRLNLAGRGSYGMVLRTVRRLLSEGHADLVTGFLSVAQPSVAPSDYLDWVATLPVTRINLIWPIEYNWATPPWGAGGRSDYHAAPVFGTWLASLFREWWRRDDPGLHIELFWETITTLLGGSMHTDVLVNDSIRSFVVNTDGGYEYSDYFPRVRRRPHTHVAVGGRQRCRRPARAIPCSTSARISADTCPRNACRADTCTSAAEDSFPAGCPRRSGCRFVGRSCVSTTWPSSTRWPLRCSAPNTLSRFQPRRRRKTIAMAGS